MSISSYATFEATLEYVRAEYDEVPNLRLTPSQAQRLQFHLEPSMGAPLVDPPPPGPLPFCTPDGLFVRLPGHD